MILYTPMQLELVLEGFESQTAQQNQKEIPISNGKLIVKDNLDGTASVVRLISTNPYDYLRPDYMPGALVRL